MPGTKSALLALLLPLAAAANITLGDKSRDWALTPSNALVKTASAACTAAYSASIACDATLLALASSYSFADDPQPEALDRLCVPACRTALDEYTLGLMRACDAKGDAVRVSDAELETQPVALVGEVLRYQFDFYCQKDKWDKWCWFSEKSRDLAEGDCDNKCQIAFYQTMHDYPAKDWYFDEMKLQRYDADNGPVYKAGWDRAVAECGVKAQNRTLDLSASTTATAESSGKSTVSAPTATSQEAQTEAASATASTSSSPAGRLSNPFSLLRLLARL